MDANNLVSLETGFSLGTYDLARLSGNIVLRAGREGEAYAGIGKDELDLCRMPLLADDQGAFGCPCSDSRRAMIAEDGPDTSSPRRLLTVIYGFSGTGYVSDALNIAQKHLEVFAGSTDIRLFCALLNALIRPKSHDTHWFFANILCFP